MAIVNLAKFPTFVNSCLQRCALYAVTDRKDGLLPENTFPLSSGISASGLRMIAENSSIPELIVVQRRTGYSCGILLENP